MTVSITEYAYELCGMHPVDGSDFIESVPMDDLRLLADMICACGKHFTTKPDVIYIAHSIPFAKGQAGGKLCDVLGAPVFWLSGLPCAVTHMAMKLATAQIRADRYKRILIFGADKAYSNRERKFFGTIMGDAVIGMMLEGGEGLHEVIACRLDTFLIAPSGEDSGAAAIQKYRDTLPLFLREAYRQCLSQSGLNAVNYIAPHTPNRCVWDVFSRIANIDRDSILDENISQMGHLNSNDSFYHYFTHCENGTISQGDTAMLINPGFGGTRGCTILRRK